jgi:hypothetical protein
MLVQNAIFMAVTSDVLPALDRSATVTGGLDVWRSARSRYAPVSVGRHGPDELAFEPGRRPVLVTALHATPQRRDGVPKPAESETGALAEALGEAMGYASLMVVGPQTGDPAAATRLLRWWCEVDGHIATLWG